MITKSSTKIITTEVNLGKIPFFLTNETNDLSELETPPHGLRALSYHTDQIIEDFPLISCPDRIKECMEFNLFIADRKTGAFSIKKNKYSQNEQYVWSQGYLGAKKGSGLKTKSLMPIAKDLRRFLDWMIDENITYEEIIAVPIDYDPNSIMEAEELLPVWRFQQHLTDLVKRQKLSFKLADRVLQNVRTFYLWSYRRGESNALPFSHKIKNIRVTRSENADAVFAMPGTRAANKRALRSYVSNLRIPKTAIQKDKAPKKKLMAYSGAELKLLISTSIYAHRTYGLFIKCGLFAGLRAFEVVQINHDEIISPSEKRVSFSLSLLRKFNKPINLRISPKLMEELWNYTQDKEYLRRRELHERRYGANSSEHPLPLFLNKSGERMSENSVKNSIAKVRVELKELGLPIIERTFHDLRATFATLWAIALIRKGYEPSEIKAKLTLLLSHENFHTVQRYLDFATEGRVGYHGAMDPWVVDIYQEVAARADNSGQNNDS
jgi:integrase|tara:strand:- start:5950 stop:7431 length:1482 start_codon:yes stop_codon:yes gene_type:complete